MPEVVHMNADAAYDPDDPLAGQTTTLDQPDLYGDLTPDQLKAVTHGTGPLLVVAGAGSGKTRVITRRIAHLIRTGVRSGQILAITFTNKAAMEMKERVAHLVPDHRATVCTFHSLGSRILRSYAARLNLDRNFAIADESDRKGLMKEAYKACGVDPKAVEPDKVIEAISNAKNAMLGPRQYQRQALTAWEQVAGTVYAAYERELRRMGAVDFDDLLYLPVLALTANEMIRSELNARYRWVLVDEYQDSNTCQYRLLRLLTQDSQNLCCVGDPDQSLYSWRGADIRNILSFEADYAPVTTATLENNYRSTPQVLHAANVVIRNNRERKDKTLRATRPAGAAVRVRGFDSGQAEAAAVAADVKQAVEAGERRHRDHAVLVRLHALTHDVEKAFVRWQVPYRVVGGLAFFDRAEVKDALAYLKLALNPADTLSFHRVVNVPPRGVGKVTLDTLTGWAADRDVGAVEACRRADAIHGLTAKAREGLKAFAAVVDGLAAIAGGPVGDTLEAAVVRGGLAKHLRESDDEEDHARLGRLDELVKMARVFAEADPARTAADFLETAALMGEAGDGEEDEEAADRVSVMTLHAAKGTEHPAVYLIGLEHERLPHIKALSDETGDGLAEERRLFFVGITRAMDQLWITHARTRIMNGQPQYARPSEFLDELPDTVQRG